MLPELPLYVPLVFALTTVVTFVMLMLALRPAVKPQTLILIGLGLLGWIAVQGFVGASGFYATDTRSVPPRFLMGIAPALLSIIALMIIPKGRAFIDRLPLVNLHYLHTVRIPVEIVLFWLFLGGAVPELMTFSGRNFDILAGITAPLITYFGLQKGLIGKTGQLIWNFICLGLVLFIVVNAVLAAPLAFQQFAFDQPNIAVAHFPYIWLPAFVVPAVIFSHLVSIRRLLK